MYSAPTALVLFMVLSPVAFFVFPLVFFVAKVPPQTGLLFVAAQMAGGVVAFPLLAACLRPYGLSDFGA
jgi:hypothetical protein